ncbi:MAG: hypothetical protein JWO31_2207, partial [Phycisphaerales bacterium]|nr:hypothetical protein [Phycisphaerales bacterium]
MQRPSPTPPADAMAANPDPDAPPTPSPLAYARAAGTRFGWRADGDTHVLTLPPRPWPDVLVQHGTALTAATLFMLVTAGMAVTMGRTALGGGRWAVPGRSMIGIDRVGLVV